MNLSPVIQKQPNLLSSTEQQPDYQFISTQRKLDEFGYDIALSASTIVQDVDFAAYFDLPFITFLFSACKQIMMIKLYQLILLLSVISTAFCYALDGSWTLRTSEIPQLKKISSGILFTFQSKISNTQQITHILTIYACNKLTYTYTLQEDQIYLQYMQTGSQIRPCISGEIVYLRTAIDLIFNFYIMGNTMLMVAPNNQPPIKFDRYITTNLAQINGNWTIDDAVFYSKITDPNVTINGSHISFCGGEVLFAYRLAKNNGISLAKERNSSCNNMTISKLANASLYRVNEAHNPNLFYIYDSSANIIMQLGKKADYPMIKPIVNGNGSASNNTPSNSSNTSSSTNSSSSNKSNTNNAANQTNDKNVTSNLNSKANLTNPESKNTTNISNPITNSSNKTATSNDSPSQTTNTTKNITPAGSDVSQNTTKKSNATTNSTSITGSNSTTITNQTSPPSQNKTNNQSALQNTSTPSTNTSNSSININKTINNATSTSPNPQKNGTNNSSITLSTNTSIKNSSSVPVDILNMVAIQSANQIFGIWYPFNFSQIPNLSSYPPKTFSKYQIIINAARILISGGCNTIFSTYSFSQGKFSNFNPVSTKNKCNENYDSVISDALYGNSQFYTTNSSPPILAIKSTNNTLLMLFSQTAPQ